MSYNESKENLTAMNDNHILSKQEVERYSRQILTPGFGLEGQVLLKQASVLIVGAGGLGCPCGLYLAGSGVGHIGIVDFDEVEVSNLHRQVLHSTDSVGMKKVESAAQYLRSLNPLIKISVYPVLLNNLNSMNIISNFDVVIDATDNVATRYLLNDSCVMLSKPLVSGSALQMEGQLTVYNYKNGPCYRCLFPVPPPPEAVTNCGEGGVLGVIPGTIGVLQALEAIKIILKQDSISGSYLVFDGSETSFKKVKLRPKNKDCKVCGNNPIITKLIDYEQFCGSKSNDKNPCLKLLPGSRRLTATEYNSIKQKPHVLVDVRRSEEFEMCKLNSSLNIPIDKISSSQYIEKIQQQINIQNCENIPIVVVCRRGNDSQKAVLQLDEKFPSMEIKDIIGGLHAWSKEVDNSFPIY